MPDSLSLVSSVNLDIGTESQKSKVNTPCEQYQWMAKYWTQIDIVKDSYESMRTNASSIILKLYGEDNDAYGHRLKHLDFLPLFSRLVNLSASMICRKAVLLLPGDDTTESELELIKSHLENINSLGNSLDVFIHDFLTTQMAYSIAGIFVDAPSLPVDSEGNPLPISLADEQNLNLRPYWLIIHPQDVIDWWHERIGVEWKLTHLRIRSTIQERDGDFGHRTIPVVKVYDLVGDNVSCRVYRKGEDDWIEDPIYYSLIRLPYIPYFAMNTAPRGLFTARPDLYELAVLNINHARVCSDLMFSLNQAAHPKLKRTRSVDFTPNIGESPTIDMSPDKVLEAQVGEDFEWLASPAHAFEALERRIEKYERDAERLWTMTILKQNNFAESGVSKSIGQNQGSSILLRTAIALESLLASCLQAHYDLMDVTKIGLETPIKLSVNRELDVMQLTDEMVNVFSEMQLKRQISQRTLLMLMQQGQRLPEDFDIDEEVENLNKEDLEIEIK